MPELCFRDTLQADLGQHWPAADGLYQEVSQRGVSWVQ